MRSWFQLRLNWDRVCRVAGIIIIAVPLGLFLVYAWSMGLAVVDGIRVIRSFRPPEVAEQILWSKLRTNNLISVAQNYLTTNLPIVPPPFSTNVSLTNVALPPEFLQIGSPAFPPFLNLSTNLKDSTLSIWYRSPNSADFIFTVQHPQRESAPLYSNKATISFMYR
jgi:hypothetical protein